MHLETLARDSLISGQNTFSLHIQSNGCCLGIGGLDNTTHDLTGLTLEILHLIRTFSLTDALLDDLTRRLRGDTPEICRSGFNNYGVTKLSFRVDLARLIQQNLGLWLHDVFHNFLLSEDKDLPITRSDLTFNCLAMGGMTGRPLAGTHADS